MDAFLQICLHNVVDFFILVVVFDEWNGIVYIVELYLANYRVAFLEFVVENHGDAKTIEETFHESSRVLRYIHHEFIKYGYNLCIAGQEVDANNVSLRVREPTCVGFCHIYFLIKWRQKEDEFCSGLLETVETLENEWPSAFLDTSSVSDLRKQQIKNTELLIVEIGGEIEPAVAGHEIDGALEIRNYVSEILDIEDISRSVGALFQKNVRMGL